MNDELRQIVEAKLEAAGLRKMETGGAVVAACGGPEALAAYLEDGTRPSTGGRSGATKAHPGAYLTKLTVEGFRGIGEAKSLALNPGPGLTLLVGRNGSGKSSFAEALEVLFTGDSKRWSDRPKIWKDGWRSLHHPHPATIEAQLVIESHGNATVTTTWDKDAPLEAAKTVVQPKGKPKTSLKALGWTDALSSHRPFLSYNELGSMLDEGPSKLYDALSTVLGLEELVTALGTLSSARLDRKKSFDAANSQREELVTHLQTWLERESDSRAKKCLEALTKKNWDLDAVELVLSGTPTDSSDVDVTLLGKVALLEAPDKERVAVAAGALRAAHEGLARIAGTDADRARHLAQLLGAALGFHQSHKGDTCPVCGTAGVLGETWQQSTKAEVERLKGLAAASEQAHKSADASRTQARALLTRPPTLLDQLSEIGLDGLAEVRDAWTAWHSGTSVADLIELAGHLEVHAGRLAVALDRLKTAAAAEFQRRQDLWKPFARALTEWLAVARVAKKGRRGADDHQARRGMAERRGG